MTAKQEKRLAQWTIPRRAQIQKAWQGKVSPRTAIKLQCLDCVGEDQKAITECQATACPLHAYRPFQTHKSASKSPPLNASADGNPPNEL